MHEFSIVRALLKRVESEARGRGASGVRRVRVRIGELAGVEPELLARAYMLLREPTLCRGADLEVERVPVRWECPQCATGIGAGEVLCCGDCGVPARLAAGDEIVLDRIEMEVP
jgi:hydrogenase nickel incorporation protein HypA/HybF